MKLVLSAPSKTFLLGEYAILVGCPALILNTEPRFELHVTKQAGFGIDNIEPQSPAGRFIQDNLTNFHNYQLKFIDPHSKQGGLGASSAQFLLVYSLYYALQQQPISLAQLTQCISSLAVPAESAFNMLSLNNFSNNLLNAYQRFAWDGIGIPPSGADLLGQLYGKLTWLDRQKQQLATFPWPFADLSFVLVRTGNKLATHAHLKNVVMPGADAFNTILAEAQQALLKADTDQFVHAVNDYAHVLQANQLVASATQHLLARINALPYILAAKGCGALGADIVLALLKTSDRITFMQWLDANHISFINFS